MPPKWVILLGLNPVLFKLKLVRWLCSWFFNSLGGCAEDPVPQKLWDRVLWYKKRVIAVVRLYALLSEYEEKKRK